MIFTDHKIQPKSKNPPKLCPLKKHTQNCVPSHLSPKQNLWFFHSFPQLPTTNTAFPRFPHPFLAGRWVGPRTTPVMLQSIDASAQGNDIGHDLFFSRTSVWDLSGNFFSGWWFHKWLAINLDEPNLYIRNGCSMIYLPSVFNPVEKY